MATNHFVFTDRKLLLKRSIWLGFIHAFLNSSQTLYTTSCINVFCFFSFYALQLLVFSLVPCIVTSLCCTVWFWTNIWDSNDVCVVQIREAQRRTIQQEQGYYRRHECTSVCLLNSVPLSGVYLIFFYRIAWNADAVKRWEVCPSVRPSACQTRELWQNGRKITSDFYTIRKTSLT